MASTILLCARNSVQESLGLLDRRFGSLAACRRRERDLHIGIYYAGNRQDLDEGTVKDLQVACLAMWRADKLL